MGMSEMKSSIATREGMDGLSEPTDDSKKCLSAG